MATWDEYESSEGDFEDDQASVVLMTSTEASDSESGSYPRSESELESNEVVSNLTRSRVEFCLTEIV